MESRSTRRRRQNRIRRQRQLRRNMLLMTSVLCLCVSLAVLSTSFLSKAESAEKTTYYKYFTSVEVMPGDSLYSLAQEYCDEIHYDSFEDYISEIRYINHLSDDSIQAGNYIVVPYYSSEFLQ